MRCRLPSSKSVVWSVQILAQLIASVCRKPIYFFNNVVKYVILKQTPLICVHTDISFITKHPCDETENVVFFILDDSRCLNFLCRRFGTLFHIQRSCEHTTSEGGTQYSETSVHKIQAPWHHPKERIQHSQHVKILNQE